MFKICFYILEFPVNWICNTLMLGHYNCELSKYLLLMLFNPSTHKNYLILYLYDYIHAKFTENSIFGQLTV